MTEKHRKWKRFLVGSAPLAVSSAVVVVSCMLVSPALAGWEQVKATMDNVIYHDQDKTFYCGCDYESDKSDKAGSGEITDPRSCYTISESYRNRLKTLEWEHIVPASLTPAKDLKCWDNGGSRENCQSNDSKAQNILFDLHNLVPSVGQINALRLHNRYADMDDNTSDFGECKIEDTNEKFEPPDCKKGDVARIWFYMEHTHNVVIPKKEKKMFVKWAKKDPVSPWESKREKRIAKHTNINNMQVHNKPVDKHAACLWEPTR